MKTQKRNSVSRFSSARLRNSQNSISTMQNTKSDISTIPNLKNNVMTNLQHSTETPKTTLVVIPLEQLTEIMTNVVQIELQKHQAQHPHTAPQDEFLNATETIAFLRVSRPTYQKLRHSGQLPAVLASDKRLLFKKSDLIDYLNSRKETY